MAPEIKITSNDLPNSDDPQTRRDSIADAYFEQIPYEPYPVQEEALLTWFTSEQGVLVCAPTGTGKTLIAEAALFEALHLGKRAYYTTPLIALTDQKFRDIQESAVKWGFSADDVGLVTGNRKINPHAKILVVVAEILLNRLLDDHAFDFDDVWAVVMDEFHSFNDRERGIVWEFGLSMLPKHVRTLLISATVGNSMEFASWLNRIHGRNLKLVQSHDRKVPLSFHWVDDKILPDHIEEMVSGVEDARQTPTLLFCFNRAQCWTVAEMLKGKKCVDKAQQKSLSDELEKYDWSKGVGPKLKQILIRGVGVHHAGVLPRYRQIVEELFQMKLLSVCVCTETLAAGLNLPARSIVMPTLLKGPRGKMKVVEAASAHQMFGRAGRPQFDDRGYVFALPHEDDVKILKWKEKYDSIPEDTKDPGLRKAKKALKKKQPKRREGQQYWTESQFQKLIEAPSADLSSRGPLTWRLLIYMLDLSPDVARIRKLLNGRLMKPAEVKVAQRRLNRQLVTLWRGGYVTLDPKPPIIEIAREQSGEDTDTDEATDADEATETESDAGTPDLSKLSFGGGLGGSLSLGGSSPQVDPLEPASDQGKSKASSKKKSALDDDQSDYEPVTATPTEALDDLLKLRGVHPLYAVFLMKHLGIADRNERIMALESLLELSRSLGPATRIPRYEDLPPGPLATTRLDEKLLTLGLASAEEIGALPKDEEEDRGWIPEEDFVPLLTLPRKLQRLFEYDFPAVDDLRVSPVWVAGEALQYGTDFNKYITGNKLQQQEGIVFRHLLRLVLLIDEVAELCPVDISHDQWRDEMYEIADQIEEMCRLADPQSTEQWLAELRAKDDEEETKKEDIGKQE